MQGRWLLVSAIIAWLGYACAKPFILQHEWSAYTQLKLKGIAAVVVCIIIWRLPTVDSFLQNNRAFAEQLVATIQPPHYTALEMQERLHSGVSLAGGTPVKHAILGASAVGGGARCPHEDVRPSRLPSHPQMSMAVQRKIATAQAWKCYACQRTLLLGQLIVDDEGARCNPRCIID
jgi:hypothetical protein